MSSPGAIDTFRLSAQRHGWCASRRRCVWGRARARVRARGTRRGEGRKPTALRLCCAFRGADGLIMGHPMVGGACMCLKWRRWRRVGEFVAMAVLPAFSARRAAQTATSEGTSSLSGCSRAQRTPIQYAMYAPRRSWVRGSHGRPTSHVSLRLGLTHVPTGGTRVKRTNCRMEGWLWRAVSAGSPRGHRDAVRGPQCLRYWQERRRRPTPNLHEQVGTLRRNFDLSVRPSGGYYLA